MMEKWLCLRRLVLMISVSGGMIVGGVTSASDNRQANSAIP